MPFITKRENLKIVLFFCKNIPKTLLLENSQFINKSVHKVLIFCTQLNGFKYCDITVTI